MKKVIFFLSLLLIVSSAIADEKRYPVSIGDSPTLGPADATVTIVEFLDFQ